MDSTYDEAAKRQYALDVRERKADVLTTKGNIATKKKDIEKLTLNTKNGSVLSPVDGEIKALNPDGGTDNYGNALPFMTIVETDGFRIKGYVNENNASVLTQGTPVVIRSRVSDRTWKGSIDSIDWNNAQQSRSDFGDSDTAMSSKYPFYVTLEGGGEGLLMGQHVYIEPDYGQEDTQAENQINLPSYFLNDPDGSPWVWAQSKSGKLEKRTVKLGDYNAEADTYPVLSGLTAEDYIAFPDDTLQAGMKCVTYDESTFNPDVSGGGEIMPDGETGGEGLEDNVPQEGLDGGMDAEGGSAAMLPEPMAQGTVEG